MKNTFAVPNGVVERADLLLLVRELREHPDDNDDQDRDEQQRDRRDGDQGIGDHHATV